MTKNANLKELHSTYGTVYTNIKDDLVKCIYLCCDKNYQKV